MRSSCCSVAVALLVLLLHSVVGSYVITTPRKWVSGSKAQVCLTLVNASVTPQDEVTITVFTVDRQEPNFGWGGQRPLPPPGNSADTGRKLLIPDRVLKPHSESPTTCEQVSVPGTFATMGEVQFRGTLGGVVVNDTRSISFATNVGETFVQTDKYLYKAGQKVQFRVLTLQGPFFKVSTEPYPEIFVETPSGSRIAQWLDVVNPSGLIHLDMQLIDEPEEGVYYIKVRSPASSLTVSKSFKIEDYVLPRFEVDLKPPSFLLADSETLKMEVCAKYTFGQPVRGKMSVTLRNHDWGRDKVEMTFKYDLVGCKKFEVPLRTFDINNRNGFVYSIKVHVTVEEEGTGVSMEKSASVDITRTVLRMEKTDTDSYRKPELPYTEQIKAEFPDGSPAALEPMSVCVGDVCRNMTTDTAGILRYTVPPHLGKGNPEVTSLAYPRKNIPNESYRAYMYESKFNTYSNSYFSPTNSSLAINPDTTKLECSNTGSGINLQLPVQYAAVNTSQAVIHVQAISRGQIQYWSSQTVQFSSNDLNVDEETLISPIMPPFSPLTVRGSFTLPIKLPITVSPSVKVVIWYSREDDEVVSDARELKIGKCLEHKVELSWPVSRVEQGSVLPLTLTAEPSSLCSLGIVDKSVELLSRSHDTLTLDRVFELAERAAINPWENSQINDQEYCTKNPPKPKVPEQPRLVHPSVISATSATLTWSVPYDGRSPITGYLVEVKKQNSTWDDEVQQIDTKENKAELTGLSPGAGYTVRVYAINELGRSEPAHEAEFVTILDDALREGSDDHAMADAPITDGPITDGPITDAPKTDTLKTDAPLLEPVPVLISESGGKADVVRGSEGPVSSARAKRSFWPGYSRFSTSDVDALKMFDESGLHLVSDLTYETRPCNEYHEVLQVQAFFGAATGAGGSAVGSGFGGGVAPESASAGGFAGDDTASATRTYFPETWLWQLQLLPASGNNTSEHTLPDTITEWVGRAVCVHPSKGLGLSAPSSITTFTPFFIDLTILPTVKKGEIMPIKVSVFNYLEDSLPVLVTLESSPEYEILGANGTEAMTDQATAGVRSVCIATQDKQTVLVRVRPLVVGAVNVTVSAVVDTGYPEQCGSGQTVNKVDRIISPITVEYEGFPREKTWTKYMCSEDLNENADLFDEWLLEAPVGIVPESERAWVTVVGDLMGPTLENLGSLIKMPYGCGEQNMLNFAPNIYVLQYLEASGQNNNATYEKITTFMKSGYQRELNYKHRDGSYSAFGESDDSGSTWLTAFVVKSFAQARQYISVDATELAMSTDWLKNKQQENGCFESVGKVLHKGMTGGLETGAGPGVLSSYVMAALLEAGEDPSGKVIANAVYCLQAAPKEGSPGPYELALKAYALSLARLPEADQAMKDLMALAVDTSAGLYWEVPNSKGSSSSSLTSEASTTPVAVELAGYALMAMMTNDPELYSGQSHRLVKWISAQRNSQGGFISTQDTVVALQALAMYESHQSKEPLDLEVSVVGVDVSATFKVMEKNKLLTQRVEVPVVPNKIILDMAGTGCTLLQGVVRYNVKDPEPSEAFNISVTTSGNRGKDCKSNEIEVCASYLLNDDTSNMAVIEVTLVSGNVPVKEDLKRVVGYGTGIIKRYEIDGNKILFYVDQFTAKPTCVKFGVLEEVEVENAKPGTVKVYDYYEPEFFVSAKYEFPRRWCHVPWEGNVPVPVIEGIIPDADLVVGEETEAPVTEANEALDDLLAELDKLP